MPKPEMPRNCIGEALTNPTMKLYYIRARHGPDPSSTPMGGFFFCFANDGSGAGILFE